MSICQVQHANGYISSTTQTGPTQLSGTQYPQSAGEAVGMLVAWMIRTHQQDVTDSAMADASSTVSLTIKHVMHLMDLSALAERTAPYLPPDQKNAWLGLSKNLANQSSAFSGAVSQFSANWNSGTDAAAFRREAKKLHELYDSGLLTVCLARSSSQVLTSNFDSVRSQLQDKGPEGAQIIEALDAVIADENLLAPECSSKRAATILQKHSANPPK